MMSDIGPGRDAGRTPAVIGAAGAGRPERQPGTVSRGHRVALLTIALGLLRSRRFQEPVIIGVVGLVALIALARQSNARARERLIAWDKKQTLRAQRRAKTRSA
jgi:hypothetical protein